MNGLDTLLGPEINPLYGYVPPPFPTWPPPSGGAPFSGYELGPVTNPLPYGSSQTGSINTATPYPPGGHFRANSGTFFPQKMAAGANGQNQGAANQLPAMTKPWEVGPIAASRTISAISPAPILGPGPQGTSPF